MPSENEEVAKAASAMSRLGWAKTKDRTARTEPARSASVARFDKEPDPAAARRAWHQEIGRKGGHAKAARQREGGGNVRR